MEVRLLDRAAAVGDLAVQGDGGAEDHRALHLRAAAVGVGDQAGVDADPGLVDLRTPPTVPDHPDDRRHVAGEAGVSAEAERRLAVAVLLVTGLRDHVVDDPVPAADVDVVAAAAVARQRPAGLLPGQNPGRAEDGLEHLWRRDPLLAGQLIDEALDREAVVDVEHRAQPADPEPGRRGQRLGADVGHIQGEVQDPLTQLQAQHALEERKVDRCDRRRADPVSPGGEPAGAVEAGLQALHRAGVVVAVAHVVGAVPLDADLPSALTRRLHRIRKNQAYP